MQLFVEKRQFFNKNKQCLNNITYHKIANLLVVLDDIICFSARFYDNLLLVFKMRFQVFPFASKKLQGFSNEKIILKSLLPVLFHIQNCIFLNFIL